MANFVNVVLIKIRPGYLEQIKPVMLENATKSIKEENIYQFDIIQRQNDDHAFIFYEVYRDRTSLDAHRETAHFKAFFSRVEELGDKVEREPIFCDLASTQNLLWQHRRSLIGTLAIMVLFKVKSGYLDNIKPLMFKNAQTSLADEEGCLHFDVVQRQDDDHKFILYEIYKDRTAFDHHLRTDHSSAFNNKLKELGDNTTRELIHGHLIDR